METRRLLLFLALSFSFVLIWTRLFPPPPPPKPQAEPPAGVADVEDGGRRDGQADSDQGAAAAAEGTADGAAESEVPDDTAQGDPGQVVRYPQETVVLGSLDPQDGYAVQVELTSRGAAVASVRLADPRMKDLENREEQVQILGTSLSPHATLQTASNEVDRQLSDLQPGLSLETVDWKVAERGRDSVTFTYPSPDGRLEIRKIYHVQRLKRDAEGADPLRTDPAAYTIRCRLQFRNLSARQQSIEYTLTGPCGVILENTEHTRKFRDIKLEFVNASGSEVFSASATQALWTELRRLHPDWPERQLDEAVGEGEDKWTQPIRYAGVDVQFFAALLAPDDPRSAEQRLAHPRIDRIWPVLLEPRRNASLADITFRLKSTPVVLQPSGQEGDIAEHGYLLFAGPKHRALLDPPPFEADRVLDYGSYFGFIARILHDVLSFLYGVGLPYWLAIICLTVIVRCCLFPLSRKQAVSAARMKELQPKINELKQKYGDDREKLARAQMELWRKYDINPLGGCLPVFVQFPVFIGLYTCLNTAVDLRLSRFLWIDNLAAPDALFQMPFSLPFLGQDFNILPCINVTLFLVQQKLFMPPPTDEQQELQHKMMNVMTILFAVMFWHVPAGLCIYFVASSLWSIGERKLLGSGLVTKTPAVAADGGTPGESSNNGRIQKNSQKKKKAASADKPGRRTKGFLERLVEAAEQAKEQAEQNRQRSGGKNRDRKRRPGKSGR